MIAGLLAPAKTVETVVSEVVRTFTGFLTTSILRAITSFGGTSINAVSPTYSFMNGGVAVA